MKVFFAFLPLLALASAAVLYKVPVDDAANYPTDRNINVPLTATAVLSKALKVLSITPFKSDNDRIFKYTVKAFEKSADEKLFEYLLMTEDRSIKKILDTYVSDLSANKPVDIMVLKQGIQSLVLLPITPDVSLVSTINVPLKSTPVLSMVFKVRSVTPVKSNNGRIFKYTVQAVEKKDDKEKLIEYQLETDDLTMKDTLDTYWKDQPANKEAELLVIKNGIQSLVLMPIPQAVVRNKRQIGGGFGAAGAASQSQSFSTGFGGGSGGGFGLPGAGGGFGGSFSGSSSASQAFGTGGGGGFYG